MILFSLQRAFPTIICCLFFSLLKAEVIDTLPPQLYVIGDTLCPDSSFEAAVRVKDFTEIRSFQFQLRWDQQSIQLDAVWPAAGMEAGMFINDQRRSEGMVNAVWFNPVLLQGLSLPDADPVLFLRFSSAMPGQVESTVCFDTTDQSFPFIFSQIINDSTQTVEGAGLGDRINFSAPVLTDTMITATTTGQSNGRIEVVIAGGKPPYQIVWSNDDVGTNISELPGGNYFCTLTDENNCTNQFGPFVVEQTTASRDYKLSQTVSLFPNPFSDKITIQSPVVIGNLELLNLFGQTIFKSHEPFTSKTLTQQINNLTPGCYWLKLTSRQGSAMCKQIVKIY